MIQLLISTSDSAFILQRAEFSVFYDSLFWGSASSKTSAWEKTNSNKTLEEEEEVVF